MYANTDGVHNADIFLAVSVVCPSGEVQTRLRLGQFDEAVQAASDYKDIFGEGKYFLELMDHGVEIERRVRDGLLEIGKKLNIPPLVTNDSHYTYANEATAHDALLCIQTGKNISDPNKYEMDVIIQVRFPGCFLVVADFIMWTESNAIAVDPGRGSAARSIVAYAMGITDLDPITLLDQHGNDRSGGPGRIASAAMRSSLGVVRPTNSPSWRVARGALVRRPDLGSHLPWSEPCSEISLSYFEKSSNHV